LRSPSCRKPLTSAGVGSVPITSKNARRRKTWSEQIRAGWIEINGPAFDYRAPFGGYKQSGNGREYGEYGLHDYLETKGVLGWGR